MRKSTRVLPVALYPSLSLSLSLPSSLSLSLSLLPFPLYCHDKFATAAEADASYGATMWYINQLALRGDERKAAA